RRSAFAKRFVWWVKDPLNELAMADAAQSLIGRHDFSRFSDKRAEEASTIVVVNNAQFASEADLLVFRIGASHFLWKMVRRLVGALVEVGRGSLDVSEFTRFIDSKHGAKTSTRFDIASCTAPPSGLFLERVVYRSTSAVDLKRDAYRKKSLKKPQSIKSANKKETAPKARTNRS